MNDLSPMKDAIRAAYDMTTYVYVDIETIPAQSDDVTSEIRKGVKPPATIKKPESIEAWHKESGAAAGDEAVAKTSFDGGRGHVCTIAWTMNDRSIAYAHADRVDGEAEIINAFFDSLPKYKSVCLVGHNLAGFDLPFLRKRAIVLGITLPPASAFPRDPKAWDRGINDTMAMWAGARDTISMDNLCKILGVPGKDGFDGSKVAAAWAAGEHQKIAEYCVDDVARTRAIHQRFLAAGW